MPITINVPGITIPSGANEAVDLATAQFVSNVLAAGGITVSSVQLAVLPGLITAASREVARFTGRTFIATPFREVITPESYRQDRGEVPTAKLTRFPVISITRCATGRTTALTIRNTSSANQEASVVFVAMGDAEFDDLTYTGLVLSRAASGVATTNTVTWTSASPYTTIAAVAASINALGAGWTATASSGGSPDLSLLPAAYLVGAREPKDAVGGVSLEVFGTGYSGYSIERSTGILRCSGLGLGRYGSAGFGDWGDDSGDSFGGWPEVEVRYSAGWATVPEQIQLVVAEMVQLMLGRLALDPSLQSETTGKYSWVAKQAVGSLSDGARGTLTYYKDGWM